MNTTENHLKTTVLKHEDKKTFNPTDVTNLALQLARRPEGSVDLEEFCRCCQIAFDALNQAQTQIAHLPKNQRDAI